MCQYFKISSNKKTVNKEYIYYFCHRSFGPRTSNKVRYLIYFYKNVLSYN